MIDTSAFVSSRSGAGCLRVRAHTLGGLDHARAVVSVVV
jgi:hypothetical protein